MNICAIICEFNPFHNGHAYLLEQAKKLSGCDAVLCLMSGSFTQRGDICIADKFVRARHAVLGGADCVAELPVAFTVAPAEIFARGAVKILASVPDVKYLAFGCENADMDFKKAAELALSESPAFKKTLKESLDEGESYIKSYAKAYEKCGGDGTALCSPNNVLALEYVKAITGCGKKIETVAVTRKGGGFGDDKLYEDFSSAGAIRKNIKDPKTAGNVPPFVFGDLKDFSREHALFGELAAFATVCSSSAETKKIYGGGEGLENRLTNLNAESYDEIIKKATAKRYSSSRIKRILLANLLGLYAGDCENYLNSDLYIKPLAVKNRNSRAVLSALSKSAYPVIMKKRDINKLGGVAEKCLKSDLFAYKVWKFITKNPQTEFDYTRFI